MITARFAWAYISKLVHREPKSQVIKSRRRQPPRAGLLTMEARLWDEILVKWYPGKAAAPSVLCVCISHPGFCQRRRKWWRFCSAAPASHQCDHRFNPQRLQGWERLQDVSQGWQYCAKFLHLTPRKWRSCPNFSLHRSWLRLGEGMCKHLHFYKIQQAKQKEFCENEKLVYS